MQLEIIKLFPFIAKPAYFKIFLKNDIFFNNIFFILLPNKFFYLSPFYIKMHITKLIMQELIKRANDNPFEISILLKVLVECF